MSCCRRLPHYRARSTLSWRLPDAVNRWKAEIRQAAESRSGAFVSSVKDVTGDAKAALLTAAQCLLIPSLWYENTHRSPSSRPRRIAGSRSLPAGSEDCLNCVKVAPGTCSNRAMPKELAAIMRRLPTATLRCSELPASEPQAPAQQHSVARMVDAYLDCYRTLAAPDRLRRRWHMLRRAGLLLLIVLVWPLSAALGCEGDCNQKFPADSGILERS